MERKLLFPEELKIEILLKLSIQSLLRFKSVCKHWQTLIENPTFATRYANISHVKSTRKVMCFHRTQYHIDVVSLLDRQTATKLVDLEWPTFPDEEIHNKEEYERFINVLGPVNGIYCIFNRLLHRWIGTLTLWNPATREYKHILPPVSFPFSFDFLSGKWEDHWYYEWKRGMGLHIGFGIDETTNDFKVVVICHWEAYDGLADGYDNWHVRVYNLSTDSWRTLYYLKADEELLFEEMYPFFHLYSLPDYVHCYLNGVFHWSTCDTDVLGFGMEVESFELIKGPPVAKYEYNCKSVWMLKEKLAMVFVDLQEYRYTCGAVVWIMMEYGVQESWINLCFIGPILGLTIVGIPNDYQIFFSNQNTQLVSFDFEDEVFNDFHIHNFRVPHLNFPFTCGSQGVLQYVETFTALSYTHSKSYF